MATHKALSPSLAALMSAAAALAPSAHAQTATGAASDSRVGYRYNEYDEDVFDGAAIGSPERYRVYSQQFQLDTRIGGSSALDVTATHEVMSGSSPWYVVPDDNGRPVQVLSGATIHDHRSALSAAYTTDAGTSSSTTYSGSYSQERDYRATALGLEHSFPINAALTLGAGGSFRTTSSNPPMRCSTTACSTRKRTRVRSLAVPPGCSTNRRSSRPASS